MNQIVPPGFASRHIGVNDADIAEMLQVTGAASLDQLIDETIPASIRLKKPLELPAALSESEYLKEIRSVAAKNKIFHSYIGLGYYNTITPSPILRNLFENPGWYTQYTPYQAEIAQGRLESLLNFQTMVIDLTGLEVANASLLDEATAAAEAMMMLYHARDNNAINRKVFFVSEKTLPQTIDVLKARSAPLGIELLFGDHHKQQLDENIFGALLQYPGSDGSVEDFSPFISQAHQHGVKIVMAADLLALTLLKSRVSLVRKWPLVLRNGLVFRWDTVVRMLHILQQRIFIKGKCREGSLASRLTPKGTAPIAWHCKQGNSTLREKKPLQIFVQRRRCLQISLRCMQFTTARRD
jgi:glycine cleavage system pyridoxal-binding protein P